MSLTRGNFGPKTFITSSLKVIPYNYTSYYRPTILDIVVLCINKPNRTCYKDRVKYCATYVLNELFTMFLDQNYKNK